MPTSIWADPLSLVLLPAAMTDLLRFLVDAIQSEKEIRHPSRVSALIACIIHIQFLPCTYTHPRIVASIKQGQARKY